MTDGGLYDDPGFHAAYARLPRSRLGLAGAPEWPDVRALLPTLEGRDVVDLGCGFGAFVRFAAQQDAASVLGLDRSVRMLERARDDVATEDVAAGDRIRLEQADLEQVRLPHASYDLAYSALVLHYLADVGRFFRAVHAGLRPGGHLVATFEHPVFTAPSEPTFVERGGGGVWPLDGYADEGPRVTDWLAPGVRKHHRTLGTTLTALAASGLVLRTLVEWAPTPDQVAQDPSLAGERDRPMFALLAAVKPPLRRC